MKKEPVSILIAFLVLLSASPILGQTILFKTKSHRFGFVHQGAVLEYDYVFTNTGSEPLAIMETKAECTCTEVTEPEKEIKPGETARIHLKFDSKSARYRQKRTILVTSNASNSPTILLFRCVVLRKKK
jgi:hypothetical protein